MPIYDLKCPSCSNIKRDVYCRGYKEQVKCNKCSTAMQRLVCRVIADATIPKGGLFLEHVEAHGKTFHSKKEMRDYERRTGTTIGCLH